MLTKTCIFIGYIPRTEIAGLNVYSFSPMIVIAKLLYIKIILIYIFPEQCMKVLLHNTVGSKLLIFTNLKHEIWAS